MILAMASGPSFQGSPLTLLLTYGEVKNPDTLIAPYPQPESFELAE